MKILLLMRHAKSSWSNPDLRDHDRPLNSRGGIAAARMGKILGEQEINPDVILCSTAKRARQTTENLLEVIPYYGEVHFLPALYHGGEEEYSAELGKLGDEVSCAMIVGHNPGVEDAVENYCGDWHRMPTAAIARIEFPFVNWQEILFDAEGKLTGLWRPRDFG